jgi:hypothetical protein
MPHLQRISGHLPPPPPRKIHFQQDNAAEALKTGFAGMFLMLVLTSPRPLSSPIPPRSRRFVTGASNGTDYKSAPAAYNERPLALTGIIPAILKIPLKSWFRQILRQNGNITNAHHRRADLRVCPMVRLSKRNGRTHRCAPTKYHLSPTRRLQTDASRAEKYDDGQAATTYQDRIATVPQKMRSVSEQYTKNNTERSRNLLKNGQKLLLKSHTSRERKKVVR